MDIIRDLIQTSNASRAKVRIVNNNGILGVVATNETTPTLPTEIVPSGSSAMPTAISVVGTTSGTIGTTDRFISFPYSGTAATKDYSFTTTENLVCDILVVGGGGGGGDGGGGGGGYVYQTNLTIPIGGTYNISVGKGGVGGGAYTAGSQGASSTFILGGTTYTAYGGGGGGGTGATAPAHTAGQVGSYGGNGADRAVAQTYTSTQGNRGGTALASSYGSAGGGGGAGGVGSDANFASSGVIAGSGIQYYRGGTGGNGALNTITGVDTYYAGGGTGGANTNQGTDTTTQVAPLGGGGIGSRAPAGFGGNGIDGTGGGGGGGDPERAGTSGKGGSGIVIIRYRKPSSEIVVSSTIAGTTDRIISFPYTGTATTKDYTITTTEALSCDILVVGGGGAGGNSMGGGGGAGGVVYAINQTLSTGTYTVKVGRGGIGLTLTDATGQGTIGIDQDGAESSLMNSNASSYISLTLAGVSQQLRGYGGGGGGIYYNPSFVNGRNGGSGGGCTESNNNGFVVNTPGSATQPATYWNGTAYVVGGKAGRQNTTTVQDYQAGGGGGLGGVSADYRNGNDGVAIDITGTSQFYAAGGGAGQYIGTSIAAGLGGSSIGGNGRIWAGSAYAAAPRDVATSGANGTGSGGGGAAYTQTPVSPAGNGGSGIVIIRYRKATNTVSNTLFSISNGGVISTSTNVYSNVIINYVDSSNVSSGTSSTGISSQWTTSGTNIYYNTSNVGIGTTDPVAPLHIYNNTTNRLLLDTTTTGTPSIEFRRGVSADTQNDYRLINDTSPANGTIKLLCENSTQSYNDTTANLAWFSSNETIIHKNTSMNGRVGIGTTYHATRRLDVLGDANISGAVSVGGLSVSGSSSSGITAIITNSLTSNVSLTIRNEFVSSSTSSSINLVRGTAGDANRDYKLGNYNAEFKVLSSVSNTDTDYIKITTAGAITNPTGTASWNTGSDRRIKENIERASYDKCYDNINRLELNRFNYIDGFNTVSRDRAQLGFIAQEVKDIFPKSISTQGYYSETLNIPDLLSIDISQINYSLYGAVKKLIEINKEDKEKLASLDNRIKTITKLLNISLDASDIVIDSSNIVIDTSNIVIDSSNLVIDSSNIAIDTSNLLDTSSNISIE